LEKENPDFNNFGRNNSNNCFSTVNNNTTLFAKQIRNFINVINAILTYLPVVDDQFKNGVIEFTDILGGFNCEFSIFEENFFNLFVRNKRYFHLFLVVRKLNFYLNEKIYFLFSLRIKNEFWLIN